MIMSYHCFYFPSQNPPKQDILKAAGLEEQKEFLVFLTITVKEIEVIHRGMHVYTYMHLHTHTRRTERGIHVHTHTSSSENFNGNIILRIKSNMSSLFFSALCLTHGVCLISVESNVCWIKQKHFFTLMNRWPDC